MVIYFINSKELLESKEKGKDKYSIQSSTTPDPRHHMGKCQKHEKIQYRREPRDQPFPSR